MSPAIGFLEVKAKLTYCSAASHMNWEMSVMIKIEADSEAGLQAKADELAMHTRPLVKVRMAGHSSLETELAN